MSAWYGRKFYIFVGCVVVQFALVSPAIAMTKIIIVPTARTMGANRYGIDLDRKAPLFNASDRKLDISPKIGLGERVQLEAKIPLEGSSVLFAGKYMFATTDKNATAAAIGIENVGEGSAAVSYLALSHLFKPVDLTIGGADGGDSGVFFTGVDIQTSKKMHVLADYNTGSKFYTSAGFQYEFTKHLGIKTGIKVPREGKADLVIKLQYSNGYR